MDKTQSSQYYLRLRCIFLLIFGDTAFEDSDHDYEHTYYEMVTCLSKGWQTEDTEGLATFNMIRIRGMNFAMLMVCSFEWRLFGLIGGSKFDLAFDPFDWTIPVMLRNGMHSTWVLVGILAQHQGFLGYSDQWWTMREFVWRKFVEVSTSLLRQVSLPAVVNLSQFDLFLCIGRTPISTDGQDGWTSMIPMRWSHFLIILQC